MSPERRLILVTGAPRTATTPVGNMLSIGRQSVALYEPAGPTGLRRFENWYPMVGPDLDLDQSALGRLLTDLADLRSEGLKPQRRQGRSWSLKTALLGSRTLHSFRVARLQPWARTVIWKDPHAMMMAPDVAAAGIPTVVTLRSPHAHAASYKRLGWRSRAKEIYPRWSLRYGPCEVCERFFDRIDEPVVSGALLWRMCYLALIRSGALQRVHLISSDQLVADEAGTYRALFAALDLPGAENIPRRLSKDHKGASAIPTQGKTHDWNRSVQQVNNYWKDTLGHNEIMIIDEITSDVRSNLKIH